MRIGPTIQNNLPRVPTAVVPAKAGIHKDLGCIPAFAGIVMVASPPRKMKIAATAGCGHPAAHWWSGSEARPTRFEGAIFWEMTAREFITGMIERPQALL